jgi:hypothetical protein
MEKVAVNALAHHAIEVKKVPETAGLLISIAPLKFEWSAEPLRDGFLS